MPPYLINILFFCCPKKVYFLWSLLIDGNVDKNKKKNKILNAPHYSIAHNFNCHFDNPWRNKAGSVQQSMLQTIHW